MSQHHATIGVRTSCVCVFCVIMNDIGRVSFKRLFKTHLFSVLKHPEH